MAIIFIRTLILYFTILISMRIMGKRQLGELELSEFIVAALVADLAATPLQEIGTPLLNGLIPILTLFCLEIIIAGISMRSIKARRFVFGNPEILIENGRIDGEKMRKNRFTIDELMQELRQQGITDLTEIEYAILETNGKLSVILKKDSAPVTPKTMNIPAESDGYTHIIINDGRVLDNNLKLLGRDRGWLKKELKNNNVSSQSEVYLLTLSETGKVYLQRKEEKK